MLLLQHRQLLLLLSNIKYCYIILLVWLHVGLTSFPALSQTLHGYISNTHGRIGIYWGCFSHKIHKVYRHSPAAQAGLLPGDEITAVDGHSPEQGDIAGDAGSEVILNIKRGNSSFRVAILRIPDGMISKESI